MLVGDRERDGAGAGADIEHPRPVEPGEEGEGTLHEHLCLGSRNQGPPIDGERQPPEPPLPEHVLERLTPGAARHEDPRGVELGRSQRTIERHVQLDPLQADRLGKQTLRVEPRCLRSFRREVLGREPQDVADGNGVEARLKPGTNAVSHAPAASSESRRSSDWIASVNSSRSPFRIWSSRCAVSLIL